MIVGFSLLDVSLAASTPMILPDVISMAIKNGKSLNDARATFYTAQADLTAKKNDPDTLVVQLQQAQYAVDLAKLKVTFARLQVAQDALNNAVALMEGQNAVKTNAAQSALDSRNLTVAQAKLAAKNATAVDVANAQNAYNTSLQNLNNAKAQIPVLVARLAQSMGSSSNDIVIGDYPKPNVWNIVLTDLQQNLFERVPTVVQAQQSVALSELNVQLSDNDWTPKRTLEDQKTALETGKRALSAAQSDALTALRDSYRSAEDAYKRLQISQQSLETTQKTFNADTVRYTSGTISKVQLQQSEVAAINAQSNLDKAVGTYFKALVNLSVSSGRDITGWIKE
ncbi:MAG: TolC family protein [Deinococcaceae bacterium]